MISTTEALYPISKSTDYAPDPLNPSTPFYSPTDYTPATLHPCTPFFTKEIDL